MLLWKCAAEGGIDMRADQLASLGKMQKAERGGTLRVPDLVHQQWLIARDIRHIGLPRGTTSSVCTFVVISNPRAGGVLCELMGAGKTCIVLALVVITRNEYAKHPRNGKKPQKNYLRITKLHCFSQRDEIGELFLPTLSITTLRN